MATNKNLTPHKSFLTPDEVMVELSLSRSTLYRRLNDGSIPVIRIGKLIRVPRVSLERLAASAEA
jgi:excisionase family DNA binding protein